MTCRARSTVAASQKTRRAARASRWTPWLLSAAPAGLEVPTIGGQSLLDSYQGFGKAALRLADVRLDHLIQGTITGRRPATQPTSARFGHLSEKEEACIFGAWPVW
jgi:hypothetical protein